MKARRWPLATIGLILTNLILFTVCSHWDRVREQRLAERGITALVYYHQHPYLALKSPLNDFLTRNEAAAATPSLAVLGGLAASIGRGPAPSDRQLVSQQQAELDAKVHAFAEIADQWQGTSLGYVPRTHVWWTLLAYQFVHGSWLHLLGNLCVLWFVGGRLERGWGRTRFVAVYLTSGIVAAGAHQFLAPSSMVPLIGASGCIAGLLGAATLLHASAGEHSRASRTPSGWPRRVALPLLLIVWFGLELTHAFFGLKQEGGVAHIAHVGGFVFGLVAAWVLRLASTHGQARLDSRIV